MIRNSHHCGRLNHVLTGDQAGADRDRVDEILKRPEHFPLVYVEMEPGDIAMYNAKHTTEGFAVYAEEAAEEDGSNQLALMAELRHGLSHDEVTVMYQPIITMDSRAVTRVPR